MLYLPADDENGLHFTLPHTAAAIISKPLPTLFHNDIVLHMIIHDAVLQGSSTEVSNLDHQATAIYIEENKV